jgi:hypothetical protein
MRTILIALLLLALIPTAAATPIPPEQVGNCTLTRTLDGTILRCTDDDGRTTVLVAHGSCLTGTYVYVSGAWVWVYCQP